MPMTIDTNELSYFANMAKPGERLQYFSGLLMAEREITVGMRAHVKRIRMENDTSPEAKKIIDDWDQRRLADDIGTLARELMKEGLVYLAQKRMPDGDMAYLAIKK